MIERVKDEGDENALSRRAGSVEKTNKSNFTFPELSYVFATLSRTLSERFIAPRYHCVRGN